MTYYTDGEYDVYRHKNGFIITDGGLVLDDEYFETVEEAIEYVKELVEADNDNFGCPYCGRTDPHSHVID